MASMKTSMDVFICPLCNRPAKCTPVVSDPDWYRIECSDPWGTQYHASGRALRRLEQAARESDRPLLKAITDLTSGLHHQQLAAWIDVDEAGQLHIGERA